METTLRSGLSRSAAVLFQLLVLGTAVTTEAFTPAQFVFGDSLVDTGENNYITNPLVPKANIVPYGESFFSYPTGRFSNARLVPDFFSEFLNLPLPQSYFKLNMTFDPLKYFFGVNFGSAGSGILNDTFSFEGVINLSYQLKQYRSVIATLKQELPAADNTVVTEILNNGLYIFCTGSNDVSYFVGNTTLQHQIGSINKYVQLLVTQLQADIQTVINSGARKIFVIGLGPLGCEPLVLASPMSGGSCLQSLNDIALAFNALLLQVVNQFNVVGPAKLVFGNAYDFILNLIQNGGSQGFTEGSHACCGGGPYSAVIKCGKENYTLCTNVNKYVFWDFVHPTERVYNLLAQQYWTGNNTITQPINCSQLSNLYF